MGSYAAHLENQLAEARRIANERAAEASSQKATISSQSERIAVREAALRLAKEMFIANGLDLPHTMEVIDAALAPRDGEAG